MCSLTPEQVQRNQEIYGATKYYCNELEARRARLRALLDKYKDAPNDYDGSFDF